MTYLDHVKHFKNSGSLVTPSPRKREK